MFDVLDIGSDFYSDPQSKVLFKKEYSSKVPSKHMWALILLVHPKSKFSDLEQDAAKIIIYKDYLNLDKTFKWENYTDVLSKIIEYLPTAPERFLATWKKKLAEINSFLNSKPYDETTYEMLSKIMKEFHPMMKQYREIEKEYQKETELSTRGGVTESLSEKGII
jgi:hypothetical protein